MDELPYNGSHRFSRSFLLFGCAALLLVAFVVVSGIAVTGVLVYSLTRKPNTESTTNKANSKVTSDPDKEEFIRVVKQNAEDPSGLEIVSWGQLKPYGDNVTFRCKLVGTVPGGNWGGGVGFEPGGERIMLEEAIVEYIGPNKISTIHCSKIHTVWHAK